MRTAGSWIILTAPNKANKANQKHMTGANILPTLPVPFACMKNKPPSTAIVMGSTKSSSDGAIILRPSTALSTEMAGVIMLSP